MSDGEGSFVTRGCATAGVETLRDAQGNVQQVREVPLCGQACQAVDWQALRRSIDAFVDQWMSGRVQVKVQTFPVQMGKTAAGRIQELLALRIDELEIEVQTLKGNRESARAIILRRLATLGELLAGDANQAALEELDRLKFFAERMV